MAKGELVAACNGIVGLLLIFVLMWLSLRILINHNVQPSCGTVIVSSPPPPSMQQSLCCVITVGAVDNLKIFM